MMKEKVKVMRGIYFHDLDEYAIEIYNMKE